MASQGPLSPGTFADNTTPPFSSFAWQNKSNVSSDNGTYATTNTEGASYYLVATNFGFSIPGGSSIDGIEFTIERKASDNSTSNFVTDYRARVVKSDGSLGSVDKLYGLGFAKWPATDTAYTYGSSSDTWSESWSSSDINNSNFGFALSVSVDGATTVASIDYIQCTVTYSAGGTQSNAISFAHFA